VIITNGARRAALGLLVLVLIVGGGNLWATYSAVHSAQAAQKREQAAQEQQGRRELAALCTTFARLTALKPPPGSATANPSRAYLQEQHATLAEVSTDLGCP
jgi:hypothetical protein